MFLPLLVFSPGEQMRSNRFTGPFSVLDILSLAGSFRLVGILSSRAIYGGGQFTGALVDILLVLRSFYFS